MAVAPRIGWWLIDVRANEFRAEAVAKPIPSYQVYKGTAFELVDQAVDFVLSKINRSIGTRAEGVRAPQRDIEFCLGHDLSDLRDRGEFAQIEVLHNCLQAGFDEV